MNPFQANSSVIRQISKRVLQENKTRHSFRKTNIFNPLIRTHTCAYQGVRNVSSSENLACFVCLLHPFRDSPFCSITYELSYHKPLWLLSCVLELNIVTLPVTFESKLATVWYCCDSVKFSSLKFQSRSARFQIYWCFQVQLTHLFLPQGR